MRVEQRGEAKWQIRDAIHRTGRRGYPRHVYAYLPSCVATPATATHRSPRRTDIHRLPVAVRSANPHRLWAPLSEVYGRRLIFIVSYFFLTIWSVGCALSKTVPQLLVFRFLCGFFGSSPLAVAGGVISDVLAAKNLGIGMVSASLQARPPGSLELIEGL